MSLVRRGMLTLVVFVAIVFGLGMNSFAAASPQSGLSGPTTGTGADPGTSASQRPVAINAAAVAPGGTGRGICGGGPANGGTAADLLPVMRWGDAMTFHTRLGTLAITDSIMREGILSLGMSAGNTFWSLSTGVVQYAVAFCPLEQAGGLADETFAKLGTAVLKSTLLTALMVFALFVYMIALIRSSSSGGSIGSMMGGQGSIVGKLFTKGLIIGLLVIMVNGANQSTGGGADESGAMYRPGTGSPGWFVKSVDSVVTEMTGSMVEKFSNVTAPEATESAGGAPNYSTESPYSCERYMNSLRRAYRDNFRISADRNYQAASAMPLALNRFWEQSGLEAWKNAQFGTNNNYGDIMFCRVLEENADIPVGTNDDVPQDATIAGIMRGTGVDSIDTDAWAWDLPSDSTYKDRTYVAWAACSHESGASNTGWSIPRDRMGLWPDNNGAESTTDECRGAFDSETAEDRDNLNAFDWEDGGNKVDEGGNGEDDERDMSAADTDFLKNLHGTEDSKGIVIVGVYILSAFLLMVVFGLFALAIIFAKILALVMIVGVLVALLAALLPNADFSRVAQYAKQYVGISFFAYGASILLALLTLFTSILVEVGNKTLPTGLGGVMPVMWTGVAPAVAAYAIHYMFKKANVPSPMNPAAAGAWGKAAAGGAVGGAIGAGTTNLIAQRMGGRVKSAAKSSGQSAMAGLKSKKSLDGTRTESNGQAKMTPGTSTETKPGTGTGGDGETPATALERRAAERERKATEAGARKEWAASEEGQAAIAAQRAKAKEAGSLKTRAGNAVAGAAEKVKSDPLGAMSSAGKHALNTGAKVGAVGALTVATGGVGGVGVATLAVLRSQARKGSLVRTRLSADQAAETEAYAKHKIEEKRAQDEARAKAAREARPGAARPSQPSTAPTGQAGAKAPDAGPAQPQRSVTERV
ncbi:hypothetical protein [Nocardioides sp. Leaf285]|uniref:hypothetical protein n=1 Tax=Nocardioides sp. Leaf285 TaxID=1736322 RepID=UPI000702AC62|nr:hypothetical protein [Nocardioides sp. Leaf285]KQP62875.1 hypothetical protein ASF47_17840 [Nocardioides sp. Leaf285]